MTHDLRARFVEANGDVWLLEAGSVSDLESYLLGRGLIPDSALPIRVEPAGDGNMNLALRVIFRTGSLILKQGRPWVEKYPHIDAPWNRTLVEGQFYVAAAASPAVSTRLPRLLDLDERHHIIALEDLGPLGDLSSIYRGDRLEASMVHTLLAWLAALPAIEVPAHTRGVFANRAMRALNHEHMFAFPLDPDNGLELNAIAPGLAEAAHELQRNRPYTSAVAAIGASYLTDGPSLVHGDFFPGSWIRTNQGVRVIDPEFCFLGSREFDYGVMLGHLALARQARELAEIVLAATAMEQLNDTLVLAFAGTEIMRRLIGVAQLPLTSDVTVKHRLLDLSRQLVLSPERGLTSW